MRLLTIDQRGRLNVTSDITAAQTPDYAILSHTWGRDEDEVTFDDLQQASSSLLGKAGHAKVKFSLDQARKDGHAYVWIDSCCIRRSDLSELSEAITSMFRWYQKAAKCYVYLSDVTVVDNSQALDRSTWEDQFRRSRWPL
jgi:hypothetical protein